MKTVEPGANTAVRKTFSSGNPTNGIWQHQHILDIDDFSNLEIDLVMNTTTAMTEILSREVKKVPTLHGKTIVNLFYEPSTRTRSSFELAAKNLSADVVNIDTSKSSVVKGESLINNLNTIQALGAEVIVIRHSAAGAPYLAAKHVNISIINAGDGAHAHPSQALLDLYTMKQHLGEVKGRKVVIVGDIMHSRVARSNIWCLFKSGARVTLCSPPTLMSPGMQDFLNNCGMKTVNIEPDIEKAAREADVIMPLRLQIERQQSGLLPSIREYVQYYQLDSRRLSLAKPGALVMHPGPMNEDIEISSEVAHSAQSVIDEQVTNGIAVRMALFYLVTGGKAHRAA